MEASGKGKRKRKRKRRRGIIVLIFLLVVLIGCGILGWFQANNLKALWLSGTNSEERQELLVQNEDAIQRILNRLSLDEFRSLTPEEEKLLRSGKLSEEEALRLLMEKPEERESAELQRLMAKIYLLRSTFTGKLDSLVAQAKQEYLTNRGKVSGTAIAKKYLSKGYALEKECDGQMESLLGEIKKELERTGGDLSIISEIRNTYENEKSIQKATLLDQYL